MCWFRSQIYEAVKEEGSRKMSGEEYARALKDTDLGPQLKPCFRTRKAHAPDPSPRIVHVGFSTNRAILLEFEYTALSEAEV